MILAKDDIEKAVSWWAGKLMDHQPHSNGDDSFTSVAVCFLSAFPSGVITARAKCWPMLPPKLASTEQTFRSRRQCFLRKKRGFWYGMATVPRLSGFVEVTEW